MRCASPSASAARRRRSPAAASPKISSPMPRTTTSPSSSSASPSARAGSSCCTARSSTISCAAPAISASTSSPARRRSRKAAGRDHRTARQVRTAAVRGDERRDCGGARHRPGAAAIPRHRQYLDRVPDRRAGRGGALWAMAVALCEPAQRARLQFLFPAAALHLHHRRSRERARADRLPGRGDHRQQSRCGYARPGGGGALARPCHRGIARLQPQALAASQRSTICCGRPLFRSPRC